MAEGKEFPIECTQVSWEELCDLIRKGHHIGLILIGELPEEDDFRKIAEVFRRVEEKRLKMAARERILQGSPLRLEKYHFVTPPFSGTLNRLLGPQPLQESASPCNCPDCQMEKLYKEFPEEADDLDNQWSAFQADMLRRKKIVSHFDGFMFAIGPDEIRAEAEKFGLDERILDALLASVG